MSDIGSNDGERARTNPDATTGSGSQEPSPSSVADRVSRAEEVTLPQTDAEMQATLTESLNANARFAAENTELLAALDNRQSIILDLSNQLTILADDVESLGIQVEELMRELAAMNARYEDMLARHQRQILSIQQINLQDLARVETLHLREKFALLEELVFAQRKIISFHEWGWAGGATARNGASANAPSADERAPTDNGG